MTDEETGHSDEVDEGDDEYIYDDDIIVEELSDEMDDDDDDQEGEEKDEHFPESDKVCVVWIWYNYVLV